MKHCYQTKCVYVCVCACVYARVYVCMKCTNLEGDVILHSKVRLSLAWHVPLLSLEGKGGHLESWLLMAVCFPLCINLTH